MTEKDDRLITRAEARSIATEAAEEALKGMLVKLGIDPEDELENQQDFAFVRNWRLSSQTVKRHGLLVAVGILVVGLSGLIWNAIRTGGPS